jgi:hypothetical protein
VTITLTKDERSVLRAVLHGAQDDDDGADAAYTATLAALVRKVKEAQ